VQVDRDTLTYRVERGGPVLVSFFGDLNLGQVAPSEQPQNLALHVASLLDLAATKVAVVQKRAQARDYVDIDALIRYGVDLPTALAAGSVVYGVGFNPLITLKALSYFDDVPDLPRDVCERLSAAVDAVDPTRLPSLAAYKGRPNEKGRAS
jgi:hypothetical protein